MLKTLDLYISKTKALLDSLATLSKTESIFIKVHELVEEMRQASLSCDDDMLMPTLYNASSTIATAPEGCSVRQLKEALQDSIAEMEAMREFFL